MGSHGPLGCADLPIEIVEEIIEALAKDPKGLGTLAAISRTCRHLSYCRRLIFSTIGILPRGFDFNSSIDRLPREYGFDNLESPQKNTSIYMKTISRIIAENPDIPKYIRTLVIFMHETNTSDDIFSSLLQHFGQITHLSLTPLLSGEPFEGIEDWMAMSDTAQDTLSKFVQRQRLTLRNLRFTKFINIPALIILTLPHLDSLTLPY